MNIKKWFSGLFKSTKNEERIKCLEDNTAGYKDRFCDIEYVNKIYEDYRNNSEESLKLLEAKLFELERTRNEIVGDEIGDLKKRLGQVEIMHAATSKKQNELFGDAMTKMIDMSEKVITNFSNLAEERIREIRYSMNLPEVKPEGVFVTINGISKQVDSEELSYDDIIILAHGFIPEGDKIFSITYSDSGAEPVTMGEEEILSVKDGMSIDVLAPDPD